MTACLSHFVHLYGNLRSDCFFYVFGGGRSSEKDVPYWLVEIRLIWKENK